MSTKHFSSMFDGTEILLGSRHNFTNIGNHTCTIGAISTMEFFNKIKINISSRNRFS